ncbi:MAG: Mov34/MPN/PAD-1 family protein [Actinomycetota bacterium]
MKVELSDDHIRRIVDHCRRALPNEGCGLLALEGDRIMEIYPTDNADESPTSYTIPPQEHYDAVMDAESKGWEIRGAFHSHPNGPPRMSATDLERALKPGWLYLVVGLDGQEPTIGAWRDGETVELG